MPETNWLVIFKFIKLEAALDSNIQNFHLNKCWKLLYSFPKHPALWAVWDTYLRKVRSSWNFSWFTGQGVKPYTCWLCEDQAQAWQALFPLHLALDALLLPEVKLGCTGGKQRHFRQVAVLGSQEKDEPQLVFAIQHILPFRKADYKIPVYPSCSSFSATCQKASLAFHIALMEFSLIQ